MTSMMPMDSEHRAARVMLPLTHAAYHILLVLATGERRGYGLKRDITACTEGRMRVGNGTLYRSLDAMLTAGLIDEAALPRRVFRLTPLGEETARAETERLTHLVAVARHTPRLWDGGVPLRGEATWVPE